MVFLATLNSITPYLVMGMGIIVFLMFFIPPNVRSYRNRRQPTITIRATVVGKEENMDNVIFSGAYARQGGGVFLLVFDTAEGNRVTLTVPRDDYYNTQPGTKGLLTYQGTKCEKFAPDT